MTAQREVTGFGKEVIRKVSEIIIQMLIDLDDLT